MIKRPDGWTGWTFRDKIKFLNRSPPFLLTLPLLNTPPTLTWSVRQSPPVGRWDGRSVDPCVRWSVDHNFLKGRKVTLLCTHWLSLFKFYQQCLVLSLSRENYKLYLVKKKDISSIITERLKMGRCPLLTGCPIILVRLAHISYNI